ncbi:MAG: N-formylglutamate amidohydrolase [Clostridia bacterium]|nr:N-formylglutamate amidohydrolase [Clostridia bacterium]
MMMEETVLHIPHASSLIPAEYRKHFTENVFEEIRLMTDWYTDELFGLPCDRIVFPVSRLVCDVERFRRDEDEIMAKKGMGAVYTKCHDGSPLRAVTAQEREAVLKRYYDPHHACFARCVEAKLRRYGACLIIDCHSFSAEPLPHEPCQDKNRPDICIGTDPFHTPGFLAEETAALFSRMGYSVQMNTPFSGTIVPAPYYLKEKSIRSVMIEVNRALYLTPGCRRSPAFFALCNDLSRILLALPRLWTKAGTGHLGDVETRCRRKPTPLK